jgi:predicted nucleotidyltransferase
MIFDPQLEKSVRQLVSRFGDISSIWLCGSRANEKGVTGDDWDLVVFGARQVAEEIELAGNFLGKSFDLKFVDPANGELKRLWQSASWEDFASWYWVERLPAEAEYHCARFGDQLVMMGGEWVEAAELTVTTKRALRLWPSPEPRRGEEPPVN